MRRMRNTWTAAAIAVALTAGSAWAQQPAAAPNSAIEPAAMAALSSMGAYLRNLKSFQVEAVTTDEDVLEDGQKIQYSGVTNILARMPDRLRADVESDRRQRLWLYDGKNFTLFARRLNYYATVPVPPTVAQLADHLEENYGMSVPLVDLFRWGAPGRSTDAITAATDIGPSAVAGTTCQQYAFRQDDIDWQIWIQKGDHPLPRKLVITTRTDEARPQSTVHYTWNLAPSYNESTFTFVAPTGAGKVSIADAKAAAAAAGK